MRDETPRFRDAESGQRAVFVDITFPVERSTRLNIDRISLCRGLELLLCVALTSTAIGEERSFFHEDVLGTSLEIRVRATDQQAAERAESAALQEIDRLSRIFSSYDQQSELSRLIATTAGDSVPVSTELADALAKCQRWTTASHGAFNPATQQFTRLWTQAAKTGMPPDSQQLAAAVTLVNSSHWTLDAPSGSVTRTSNSPLNLDAIAKGIILDQVAEKALTASSDVDGVMLNIGGDLRVAGEMSTVVAIADSSADAVGGAPAETLTIDAGAVATSGNSERGWIVGDRRYSHIIDPRTGAPASEIVSATVIADEAATADVLATICSVLSPDESLKLIGSLAGVACRLQTADGKVVRSEGWPRETPARRMNAEQTTNPAASKPRMTVEFEIARPSNSRRYRRPYVAVWIEDEKRFPVRTLCVFLMQNDPGPRWYRDLRRWYSGDQIRSMASEKDLIATISKPTRNPGIYKVVWDGADDDGKAVPPGNYTLFIESAREHGSYQLMKHAFDVGEPFETQLKPNQEISAARVQFELRPPP